jgi:hypothetical protein
MFANKDRYHPSCGVLEPRLVPRGVGMVRTIYPRERREFVPRGHIEKVVGVLGLGVEFVGHSFAHGQY